MTTTHSRCPYIDKDEMRRPDLIIKQNKKELTKVITFLKSEKTRIKNSLKKQKTENCESAFLFGEQKQIDYILNWLEQIDNPKLLDE